MSSQESSSKDLIKKRFTFFFEVLITIMGVFLFSIIPIFLPRLFIEETSPIFGILQFSLRGLAILIAIPLFLYFSTFLINPKEDPVREENFYPSKSFLNLYKITKKNYKYQILYGILILFLVFIPLDFLTYLFIPEMLQYTADSLLNNPANSYLAAEYSIFIISVIIIQISVGVYEETLVRGFVAFRANNYVSKMSAVVISSLFFGLGHFAYILVPTINFPILFPIIWFLQTFFVGLILSLLVLNKKWIIPAIIAHALNNIISAHAVWNYLQGNSFGVMIIYLYIPLLIISGVLFVFQFSQIKKGIKIGVSNLKSYFNSEKSIGKTIIEIIFDIIIAILIFFVAVVISF